MTVNSGAVSPTIHDSTSSSPDAHEHREEQADAPRRLALRGRQLVDQDRDENDVVDAEHELERRQREKRDPDLRIGQQSDDGFHEWAPY